MYVRVNDKGEVVAYPYSATDLIHSTPEVSWPARPLTDEELASFGVYPVEIITPPDYGIANEMLRELQPVYSSGRWWQRWEIAPLSDEDKVNRQPLPDWVDEERDQRISAGVTFMGHRFQTHADARENINGASTFALAAIITGAQVGDYRWNGGTEDFTWLTEDNVKVPMDAHTMLAFGKFVANHKANLIYRCRQIKDTSPIPLNYMDDSYWT